MRIKLDKNKLKEVIVILLLVACLVYFFGSLDIALDFSISEFLVSLGNNLNNLIETCGGTLDNLIYGRTSFFKHNYYLFDMVIGNPYSIIGSTVYVFLKRLILPSIVLLIFFKHKLEKITLHNGINKPNQLFKDFMPKALWMALLAFFMPNIIDILISLRNIPLHYISSNLSNDMLSFFKCDAGDGSSLVGFYKANAESGYLSDAILYLGASFIPVFYIITYISTAVAIMLSFMLFPMIGIFSFTGNTVLKVWLKEMIGNIFAPALDALLLLMPLLLNQFLLNRGHISYVFSFIACYVVILLRAVSRSMLGVGGNLCSELLGFGALIETAKMLFVWVKNLQKAWKQYRKIIIETTNMQDQT